MSKYLLTMIAIGLAVCLGGCTDNAADEGDDAAADPAATAEPAGHDGDHDGGHADGEHDGDHAAGEHSAGDDHAAAEHAAAVTMAKLDGVDVEAGCAKCAYKIAGVTECMLAMKTGDKAYIVDGTDIISDDVGLCSATRPAKVTGDITDDTHFTAASFDFTDGN